MELILISGLGAIIIILFIVIIKQNKRITKLENRPRSIHDIICR